MIKPFKVSPFDAMLISVKAITPKAKYSGGLTFIAKIVNGQARDTIPAQPANPPIIEPNVAVPHARAPSPPLVMGYPSQQEATVPGPPGVLSRTDAAESPY